MSNYSFARVVLAAVLFSAALFLMPMAKISLPLPLYADAQTFTATPLKQMDSVDVELKPIWTPTKTIYLAPTAEPVSAGNINPTEYFPPTDIARTLAVGFSMMAGGVALIGLAGTIKSPGSNNTGLTI